jgi:hypothetical protein
MNIRPLLVGLLFLLAGVVTNVAAQDACELVTVKNEAISFVVQSRFEPVVGQAPSDGAIDMVEDPVFNYTITYTPDTDFTGDDGLLLVSFPFDQSIAFKQYEIQVLEAFVKANHDFAATVSGVPVTISPLLNDSTNIGALELTGVPVTNAGTTEIIDGNIVFTPALAFVGLTDLNYTVCSVGNACALGTVSISVQPPAGVSSLDTVRVFTTREEAQYIFAPANAVASGAPQSGSMTLDNGVMAYLPNAGFIGDEFLEYSIPGTDATTVYHITVLDLRPNSFAAEDREYTAVGTPRTFNVLYNDLYSVFADCVTFSAPLYGTLTEGAPNGQVTYTPPANWSGVDEFTYSSKAFNCEGEAEIATAYIFVSNFTPAADETTLTVPAGTPVNVGYDAPGGGNVDWLIAIQPEFGTVLTDAETGKISYQSNGNAAGQTDVFTLTYCLNADEDGNCQFSTDIAVTVNITAADDNACVDEDCVWPGDTNNDGIVDVGDLLPIGRAMGQRGTPRLGGNPTGWAPQYSADWLQDERNGLNLKHIDANGDQMISALDTAVVMANMGLGHGLRPQLQNFSTFQLSLIGPAVAEPGDLILLDLIAGNNAVIVEDVYGIRWPFVYDPEAVDESSVEIVYGEDSWASYDSPILGVSINNGGEGVMESAFTRTNGEGISGFGRIAVLSAVIVEDVYGIRSEYDQEEDEGGITTTLGGGDGAAVMTGSGHMDAVTVAPFELTIKRQAPTEVIEFTPTEAADYLDDKLLAYPNPTTSNLTVHLNGQQRYSALQLTDLTGRVLLSEQGLDTNHRELSLGQMPNGIYTLTITTDAGVVNRKVEVLK